MSYLVSDIVTKVRLVLDEIQTNDADFVGGADNVDLDSIIASNIELATEFCVLHANSKLLVADTIKQRDLSKSPRKTEIVFQDVHGDMENSNGNQVYVGKCTISGSVLRFCYADVSTWKRRVVQAIWENNEQESAALRDYITTGVPERPKVYICKEGDDTVIYLYSIPAFDEEVKAEVGVILYPKITNENINIPDKLYNSVIMQTAAQTLLTLRDAHAESLFNRVLIMIEADKRE